MSNFNKVLLMGRLTRDPELRYTSQGVPVTDIGVAVNREFTDTNNERRKDTVFVDVTFWRRRAEVLCQYLHKGDPIFLEGRLAMDSWEGQDGQRRTKLRVVGDEFRFLSRGGRGADGGHDRPEGPDGDAGYDDATPAYRSSPKGGGSRWSDPGSDQAGGSAQDVDESDVPF